MRSMFALLGIFIASQSAALQSRPALSASFYNLWAAQISWTADQWEEDLQYAKDIGIDWAFVTYTSCLDTSYTAYCWSGGTTTNKTQALYKSSNPQYVQVGDDVLGSFLAAAEKVNVSVLVGLQLIRMTNVSETAQLYLDLASDLHSGYGHFTSFRGFYGTQEWEPSSYVGQAQEIGLNFLGPISDHIHTLDPSLEFGLSPSLSDSITVGPCPAYAYSDYGTYLGPCGQVVIQASNRFTCQCMPRKLSHAYYHAILQTTVHVHDFMTPSEWAAWWQTGMVV